MNEYSSLNVRFTDDKFYRNASSSDHILPKRILRKINRKHAEWKLLICCQQWCLSIIKELHQQRWTPGTVRQLKVVRKTNYFLWLCIHLQQQYFIAVHVGHYMVFAYATLIVKVNWLPAVSGVQRCIVITDINP